MRSSCLFFFEFPFAEDFVLVFQLCRGQTGDPRTDRQLIVESRVDLVVTFDLHHDQKEPAFLHRAIVATLCPKQFSTSQLKKVEIVGVMQITHRVGFAIPNADLDFVCVSGHGQAFQQETQARAESS